MAERILRRLRRSAEQAFQQFRAPRAHQTGDAQYFPTAQLKADLEKLVKKGDMVDVMIVAGMIHARESMNA